MVTSLGISLTNGAMKFVYYSASANVWLLALNVQLAANIPVLILLLGLQLLLLLLYY